MNNRENYTLRLTDQERLALERAAVITGHGSLAAFVRVTALAQARLVLAESGLTQPANGTQSYLFSD